MGLLKAGRTRSPHASDRRGVLGHLACRGRRATLLRQARAAEAQGRRVVGGAGRTQRGGGGVDARCRALAAARRSARPRRGRGGRAGSRWTISRPRTIRCGRPSFWPGSSTLDFAAAVGRDLAIIHARSAADPNIPAAFANDDTFEAIRIEPYLRATGRAHPELAARFDALAHTTLTTKRALVHGDVSPKNILQRPGRAGVPRRRMRLVRRSRLRSRLLPQPSPAQGRARRRRPDVATSPLFRRWRAPISLASIGRAPTTLEARAAALLPALFLARVDGKSPVEYLTRESERAAVRRCAMPLIADPPRSPEGCRRRVGAARDERARHPIARRAAHLGLARPPDRRGGSQLERRRGRPRHCAGRRLARLPRGDRQARRRQALRRLRRAGRAARDSPRKSRRPSSASTRSIRPRSTRDSIALDGTPNKARLGGNALTAVSLGVLHAAAASRGLPLWRYCLGDKPAIIPLPEIQIFGGGAHAGRRTDVQDFMVDGAARQELSPRRWR